MQAEGGKGGSKPERERQQTQARGAGRRDERRRLAGGGGGGRRAGVRRFVPGKEVRSGCKLRGLQRGKATDGKEVVKRVEITTRKMGE